MADRTLPRKRSYSSALEEESDDNTPQFNRRISDLTQTFESIADEQLSQRNSGTQRHTDGPLQANENEPILARGSAEDDEERNDDEGSLIIDIPALPQREPIVSPPREPTTFRQRESFVGDTSDDIAAFVSAVSRADFSQIYAFLGTDLFIARGSAEDDEERNDDEGSLIIDSSVFEEESDDNTPQFNRRISDLTQTFESITDEQLSQRNSGTQRHTDGPLQANENEPILARGSAEDDEERNDDEGSLIIDIPALPQREPIVSPPREPTTFRQRESFVGDTSDDIAAFVSAVSRADFSQIYAFLGTDLFIARGSAEDDEERNDDEGSLIIDSSVFEEESDDNTPQFNHRISDLTQTFESITDEQLMTFDEPEVQFTTGLLEGDIKNIPTICITKADVESQVRCTICCTDYNEGDMVNKLPCNHLYHIECVTTWLKSNGTCPNCRQKLNTNN